ncbi:186_t:CDS:2 [Entrophospora sp. SA101]|nr:186_t:CDS:2 [Entrophospora sp. SA101]
MPKPKLTGPCSIHNCDKNSNNFRCLSDRAIEKATTKGNLQKISLFTTRLTTFSTLSDINLLFGDKIKKMITVLYSKRHDRPGTSCDRIDPLGNSGVSVTYKTSKKYFNENKNNLCIYNLDDYHNIHEKRHPNHTTLSETVHLATSISKKIEGSMPVPIMYNNASDHNPNNIDPSLICDKLIKEHQRYFDLSYIQQKAQWINNTGQLTFDRIDQITIHCYDNAIAERKRRT